MDIIYVTCGHYAMSIRDPASTSLVPGQAPPYARKEGPGAEYSIEYSIDHIDYVYVV